MEQIVRIATAGLPAENFRVVFAAEDNRESMRLHHWIVTVERYPADYHVIDEVKTRLGFMAPPCPESANEFCSIREIPGEPLFRGRFDAFSPGLFHSFVGNMSTVVPKILAFRGHLKAHPEWTQADIVAALASAGAKYGPDKKKEFTATLPLDALQAVFGPMRLKDVSSMQPALMGWPAYWKVRTVLARDPKTRIVMYFEPFEGQLQSLYISQPVRTWDAKTKTFIWKFPDD